MRSQLLLRRLPHLAWLLVVWVALWGRFSLANVLSGLVVVAVFAWIFTDIGPRPAGAVRIGHAVALLGWFAKALAESTWEVARLTLSRQPVKPAVIAFALQDVSDAVATLVANMISLTPGTLTLDVRSDGEDSVLYIHVLHLEDEAATREDLATLRRLAMLAFGGSSGDGYLEESS